MADDKTSVTARAEDRVSLTFGRLFGLGTQTVAAQAKVTVVGKMRLCMLTLDPGAAGAFNLQKNAQVTALGCSLYSNSASPSGMVGGDNSMAKADTICSSGGYIGLRANFSPPPQTECPVIADPLGSRPMPVAGACVSIPISANKKGDTSKNEVDQDATLDPGTYCGGLHITKKAIVTLRAGTYVMKDGPLIVDKKATMSGTDVAFYFTATRVASSSTRDDHQPIGPDHGNDGWSPDDGGAHSHCSSRSYWLCLVGLRDDDHADAPTARINEADADLPHHQ